jgi:hypothetical protein
MAVSSSSQEIPALSLLGEPTTIMVNAYASWRRRSKNKVQQCRICVEDEESVFPVAPHYLVDDLVGHLRSFHRGVAATNYFFGWLHKFLGVDDYESGTTESAVTTGMNTPESDLGAEADDGHEGAEAEGLPMIGLVFGADVLAGAGAPVVVGGVVPPAVEADDGADDVGDLSQVDGVCDLELVLEGNYFVVQDLVVVSEKTSKVESVSSTTVADSFMDEDGAESFYLVGGAGSSFQVGGAGSLDFLGGAGSYDGTCDVKEEGGKFCDASIHGGGGGHAECVRGSGIATGPTTVQGGGDVEEIGVGGNVD